MEQNMTFNAHLSILSAIIIGLAIVKLLQGIAWMIHGRKRIRMYWVHLGWVVFTIIGGSFHYFNIGLLPGDVRIGEGFYGLPEIILTPLFIYLFACLLFPRSGDDGPIDLKDFYYKHHSWIFGTWTIILLIPTVLSIIRFQLQWDKLPLFLSVFLFGALALTRNKWYHMAMVILALLSTFAMYKYTISISITP